MLEGEKMLEIYCKVNERPLDTMLQDFITCPYCGYQDADSWEWADMRGSSDYECPKCENIFILDEPVMTIQYTTVQKGDR